jgi:hypothetical protein
LSLEKPKKVDNEALRKGLSTDNFPPREKNIKPMIQQSPLSLEKAKKRKKKIAPIIHSAIKNRISSSKFEFLKPVSLVFSLISKNKKIKQIIENIEKSFPMPLNIFDSAFSLGTLPTFKKVLKNNPAHPIKGNNK